MRPRRNRKASSRNAWSTAAKCIGLRLNWKKRYITLAPVATLIGLAFRLKDPDKLLGDAEDRGITCALIPRDTAGIEIGLRHDPMGVPFQNGPIVGTDVFVPLDEVVIGGRDGIGHGWRMLMESLAAGRSISLPALSVGAAQMATRICGAYATVREQFDTPIGRFEGIEEPLARIAGLTYLMTATRTLTCGALDAGEKPAVLGNICKAYLTDGMRQVIADAMDIRAGSAIQRGPRNTLARALGRGADRHHGRGREHPDALDDHLRPGRDPLPSVRAEGNRRGRGERSCRVRQARSSAT